MIKLIKGNCLTKLEEVAPASVDMCLIDPPYSSGGLFAGDRKMDTRTKYTDTDFLGAARFQSFSGDNMDQRAFTKFLAVVSAELREKTKEGGVVACFTDWRQLPAVSDALQMGGWVWRGVVVWDKVKSRNILGRYRNDCEYIVWGTNGAREVKPEVYKGFGALPGVYRVPSVTSNEKHHQTEKPVALLRQLLKICPVGGVVLDCFMGSGSTGVAAVEEKLGFIGIELNSHYFETAQQRIGQAIENGDQIELVFDEEERNDENQTNEAPDHQGAAEAGRIPKDQQEVLVDLEDLREAKQ